jgi:hypothetical protein
MLEPAHRVAELPWRREPLRVPREDRALLSVPLLDEAIAPARHNATFLDASQINIQGRTLARLRDWTRGLALDAAAEYRRDVLDREPPSGREGRADAPARPLFVTGHQPSLFHPGVWAKNFAARSLAAATGGTAVNLIIDNDIVASRRIRVPAGDRSAPTIETLPFDEPLPAQPWEDAVIGDRPTFDGFGRSVTEHMRAWGTTPLAAECWEAARAAASRGSGVRDALTSARVALERRWGVANVELPLSRLCETDAFRWFAAHLLAHLPRFQQVHNAVLAEYRSVNRVRSRTHPVPELATDGAWLEAPFWIWHADDQRRKRVFARQLERHLELSDGETVFSTLRLKPEMDGCCAVEDLRELYGRGLRFRTRALTTTLFARLCLADLFVHGIGGAKYDEMTDRVIARFFGLPAPEFLTLSATVQLPLGEGSRATPGDLRPVAVRWLPDLRDHCRRLKRQLRDLGFNAERYLPHDDPDVRQLVAEKRRLIEEQDAAHRSAAELMRRERRRQSRANYERFQQLRSVQSALADRASEHRRHVHQELNETERRLAANDVLSDREYSYCLYPEDTLRPFLTSVGG